MDETLVERRKVKKSETETYKKPEKTLEKSKKAKPLNKKILLLSSVAPEEAIAEAPLAKAEEVAAQVPVQVPDSTAKKPKTTSKAKKLNFAVETEIKESPNLEGPVPVQPTEVTIIKESETPVVSSKAKKVSSKKKVTLKLEE
jgi:hypothetical protein